MVRRRLTLLLPLAGALVLGLGVQSVAPVQATNEAPLEGSVMPMLESSCMVCHGDRTKTPLNFNKLGFDLADRETFKRWERVFERVSNGEMPPSGLREDDQDTAETALNSLKTALVRANVERRGDQRTPLRRLTRFEWENTIQDLLRIDEAHAKRLGQSLPAEADTGGFDVVAAKQGISPLHVRSYLEAADAALDIATTLGPRPVTETYSVDYSKSNYLHTIATMKQLGGGIVKRLDDAYVAYFEAGSTYTYHTQSEGFVVPYPGRYNVAVEAYAYQAKTPVTLTLFQGYKSGSAAVLNDLLGSLDLVGDAHLKLEVSTFLRPGELLSPVPAGLEVAGDPALLGTFYLPENNVNDYKGEGVAIKSITVEGPLFESWPTESARELLAGIEFEIDSSGAAEIRLTKEPYEHVKEIVGKFAPRAFRRPLEEGELEAYADLAQPFLAAQGPFLEALKVPLRAILTSPQFLYHADLDPVDLSSEGSAGELDDYAMASRLSYMLWRSMPDDQLFDLAAKGRLSDPAVLNAQVERLLNDGRSQRFVADFAGQAFRLHEIKATSPDTGLYPEYDAQLGQAMQQETEHFLTELIRQDLGVGNLIDSDFTFVNRRLGEHYGLEGIEGQHMRRVSLPANSPRGGLLTQASILKITSNGTTTSPVPRGNWVLANLLGQPAPPPPAGVEGLEPDIRGTTTIREQLAKHRSDTVCNSCHRKIDPPGFALEAFDPVGGYRDNYRKAGKMFEYQGTLYPTPYQMGPPVDSTGETPNGEAFAGIREYKKLLLASDTDQVAFNLVSQLLVYGTGAEIEFADRDDVASLTDKLGDRGYPLRTMIKEVVGSDIFRRR